MDLDELDKDILEYAANVEPWHILCSVFYYKFTEYSEIIDRVLALQSTGLLSVRKGKETFPNPTRNVLLADAQHYDWYEDVIWPKGNGPWWNIETTERGIEYVKDRFQPRSDMDT